MMMNRRTAIALSPGLLGTSTRDENPLDQLNGWQEHCGRDGGAWRYHTLDKHKTDINPPSGLIQYVTIIHYPGPHGQRRAWALCHRQRSERRQAHRRCRQPHISRCRWLEK